MNLVIGMVAASAAFELRLDQRTHLKLFTIEDPLQLNQLSTRNKAPKIQFQRDPSTRGYLPPVKDVFRPGLFDSGRPGEGVVECSKGVARIAHIRKHLVF